MVSPVQKNNDDTHIFHIYVSNDLSFNVTIELYVRENKCNCFKIKNENKKEHDNFTIAKLHNFQYRTLICFCN